jgi:hypothetical protein
VEPALGVNSHLRLNALIRNVSQRDPAGAAGLGRWYLRYEEPMHANGPNRMGENIDIIIAISAGG